MFDTRQEVVVSAAQTTVDAVGLSCGRERHVYSRTMVVRVCTEQQSRPNRKTLIVQKSSVRKFIQNID